MSKKAGRGDAREITICSGNSYYLVSSQLLLPRAINAVQVCQNETGNLTLSHTEERESLENGISCGEVPKTSSSLATGQWVRSRSAHCPRVMPNDVPFNHVDDILGNICSMVSNSLKISACSHDR